MQYRMVIISTAAKLLVRR